MAFQVTGPEQTINGRTVKVFFTEQILFDVQITDIGGTQINNYDETSGTETVIDLEAAAGDQTALFPAGAVVYLFVESGAGYTDRGVVETSVFGTPHAGVTTITFTELFLIGSTSVIDVDDYLYVISQKKSRFWRLYAGNTSTAVTSELYVHPQETGLIEIDVGPSLQDYLRTNSLNHFFFTIGFREAPTAGTIHGTDYLAIDGIEGNMSDYGSAAYGFLHDDADDDGAIQDGTKSLDRFFTHTDKKNYWFDRARYWKGWTIYSYYIIDKDTPAADLNIYVRDMDSDFSKIRNGFLTNYVIAATDPQVIEWEVKPSVAGVAADDVFFLATAFTDVEPAAADTLQGKREFWEVVPECKNPVMVKWRNGVGGFSFWLFQLNQINTYNVTIKGNYKKYSTSDLSTNNTLTAAIGTPTTIQKMTLEESNLTQHQSRALKEILSSHEVYVYLEKNGTRDIRVTIPPQNWGFESMALREEKQPIRAASQGPAWGSLSTGAVQIEVEFPPNFDFYKAKGY